MPNGILMTVNMTILFKDNIGNTVIGLMILVSPVYLTFCQSGFLFVKCFGSNTNFASAYRCSRLTCKLIALSTARKLPTKEKLSKTMPSLPRRKATVLPPLKVPLK